MLLNPKLHYCLKGCKLLYFTDVTGIYNEDYNPNGWGEPVVERLNIISAEIIIKDNCNNIYHIYNVTSQIPNPFPHENSNDQCWEYEPLELELPDKNYSIEYVITYIHNEITYRASNCEEDNLIVNGTFDENLDDWATLNMTHSNGTAVFDAQGSRIFKNSIPNLIVGQPYIISFDVIDVANGSECSPRIIGNLGTDTSGIDITGFGNHTFTGVFVDTSFISFILNTGISETCMVGIDNICVRPAEIEEVNPIETKSSWCESFLNDCKFRCCIDKLISQIPKFLCEPCDKSILNEVLLIEALYIGYLCAAACDKENLKIEIEKRLERFCNFKDCKC